MTELKPPLRVTNFEVNGKKYVSEFGSPIVLMEGEMAAVRLEIDKCFYTTVSIEIWRYYGWYRSTRMIPMKEKPPTHLRLLENEGELL